ncbi:MAG: deoxyribose-phosphate aldolase [Prolixibacteraceae bacterium]|jgi:deoxyribose-phosphate aldolase|nr:deoxyribose-phosphate aldolase [Prolixibacteraceae bacterium]
MKPADIAKMINHSILHPTFTDEDLKRECEIAKKYKVATVCVKPYHTALALEILKDSDVAICAVIGFPHGNSTTQLKIEETKKVISDGATEVDMVINIGKALQADWNYIQTEIERINQTCLSRNAILKVIFENDFLPDDTTKIKLCEICSNAKVAFVKTSTGYGFVKNNEGTYSYKGATEQDLKLMRKHSDSSVEIKAAGGVRTFDDIIKVRELGVTRVGATATIAIMEEAAKRL